MNSRGDRSIRSRGRKREFQRQGPLRHRAMEGQAGPSFFPVELGDGDFGRFQAVARGPTPAASNPPTRSRRSHSLAVAGANHFQFTSALTPAKLHGSRLPRQQITPDLRWSSPRTKQPPPSSFQRRIADETLVHNAVQVSRLRRRRGRAGTQRLCYNRSVAHVLGSDLSPVAMATAAWAFRSLRARTIRAANSDADGARLPLWEATVSL